MRLCDDLSSLAKARYCGLLRLLRPLPHRYRRDLSWFVSLVALGMANGQQSVVEEKKLVEASPWQKAISTTALTSGGMATALALGKVTGPAFMNLTTTLGLAGLIGFRAVWNVAPALHSPLMCEWLRLAVIKSYTDDISRHKRFIRPGRCRRSFRNGWRTASTHISPVSRSGFGVPC
jgi:NAD(P) transhydrogenase